MARAAILLGLVLTALSGCGGAGESEDDKVKKALEQFASDVKTGDAKAFCEGVTPETQQVLELISRGIHGREASCEKVMERQLEQRGGLTQDTLKAIDAADVAIEGNTARVRGRGEEERLPLRKVEDEWRVDVINSPWEGYGLRTTAACTENTLRNLRRPLPKPTRPGIAADAKISAADYGRLIRTIEKIEPPPGEEDAHRDLLRLLRANQQSWTRAQRKLAGFGAPLKSFNQALKAEFKRTDDIKKIATDLEFGCFGNALTLSDADDYRKSAHRTCRASLRRFNALKEPSTPAELDTFVRRFESIGRQMASSLRKLKAPDTLRRLHRDTVTAFAATIRGFDRLARPGNTDPAVERFELSALRYTSGFFRLGLPRCGEV